MHIFFLPFFLLYLTNFILCHSISYPPIWLKVHIITHTNLWTHFCSFDIRSGFVMSCFKLFIKSFDERLVTKIILKNKAQICLPNPHYKLSSDLHNVELGQLYHLLYAKVQLVQKSEFYDDSCFDMVCSTIKVSFFNIMKSSLVEVQILCFKNILKLSTWLAQEQSKI